MKPKVRNIKYKVDSELAQVQNVKGLKRVAETEEDYKDLIKEAKIVRVANKGEDFITQNVTYNVMDIEVDWDNIVYKYIHNGEEHFSNFKFNNPVETIYPQINGDDTATA
jgi:hypothetical protein